MRLCVVKWRQSANTYRIQAEEGILDEVYSTIFVIPQSGHWILAPVSFRFEKAQPIYFVCHFSFIMWLV